MKETIIKTNIAPTFEELSTIIQKVHNDAVEYSLLCETKKQEFIKDYLLQNLETSDLKIIKKRIDKELKKRGVIFS